MTQKNERPRAGRCLAALVALTMLMGAAEHLTAQSRNRVLLIGDSITAGTLSGGDGYPFAQLLRPLLGPGYEVINVGCGGTTTVDWTISHGTTSCDGFEDPNLFEGRAVPELPAEVVTIMFGTNDSVGFFEQAPIEVSLYQLALTEIIDNLFAFGAGQVLLMTPPRRPCNNDLDVRDRLIGYRRVVLEICETREGVVCGPDVFKLLDPVDDFAGCDVHPNQQGHARMARELADDVLGLSLRKNP